MANAAPSALQTMSDKLKPAGTLAAHVVGYAAATQAAGKVAKRLSARVEAFTFNEDGTHSPVKEAIVDGVAGLIPAAAGVAFFGSKNKDKLAAHAVIAVAGVAVGALSPLVAEWAERISDVVSGAFDDSDAADVVQMGPAPAPVPQLAARPPLMLAAGNDLAAPGRRGRISTGSEDL